MSIRLYRHPDEGPEHPPLTRAEQIHKEVSARVGAVMPMIWWLMAIEHPDVNVRARTRSAFKQRTLEHKIRRWGDLDEWCKRWILRAEAYRKIAQEDDLTEDEVLFHYDKLHSYPPGGEPFAGMWLGSDD